MDRLPGFRDFYPEPVPNPDLWSAAARRHVFHQWRQTSLAYGFQEYDGPPLEPLDLFTRKSGDEIVGQLYNFEDKGKREVALRPEMTPTLARMVAAHARNYKKPIKWFSIPQLFRYERQQKGRLREHFQWNADIIGETDPAADAEIIALLIDALRALGLTAEDFVIRLSSREAWKGFFDEQGGQPEQEYGFYQAIDKLDREPEQVNRDKLKAVGFSLEKVTEFIEAARPIPSLAAVLDNLEARGMKDFVRIDYGVIRGLAYYTGVVFEAFDRKGDFRAIAGGGRYDNLIKLISNGKVDLPSLGFGMGDVVLMELLKSRGLLPAFDAGVAVYCLIEEESLRGQTLGLLSRLRQAGLVVEYSLTPLKPDKQFKRARELGASYTAVLQQASPESPVEVRLKCLEDRSEKILPPDEAVTWVTRS